MYSIHCKFYDYAYIGCYFAHIFRVRIIIMCALIGSAVLPEDTYNLICPFRLMYSFSQNCKKKEANEIKALPSD